MLPNLAESVLSDEDNYGDNDYDDEYYAVGNLKFPEKICALSTTTWTL